MTTPIPPTLDAWACGPSGCRRVRSPRPAKAPRSPADAPRYDSSSAEANELLEAAQALRAVIPAEAAKGDLDLLTAAPSRQGKRASHPEGEKQREAGDAQRKRAIAERAPDHAPPTGDRPPIGVTGANGHNVAETNSNGDVSANPALSGDTTKPRRKARPRVVIAAAGTNALPTFELWTPGSTLLLEPIRPVGSAPMLRVTLRGEGKPEVVFAFCGPKALGELRRAVDAALGAP